MPIAFVLAGMIIIERDSLFTLHMLPQTESMLYIIFAYDSYSHLTKYDYELGDGIHGVAIYARHGKSIQLIFMAVFGENNVCIIFSPSQYYWCKT